MNGKTGQHDPAPNANCAHCSNNATHAQYIHTSVRKLDERMAGAPLGGATHAWARTKRSGGR
eukprot:5724291-Alexandrium_andersonii.AAC.1